MQRLLITCLTALCFGVILSATPLAGEAAQASVEGLAALPYDSASPGPPQSDTDSEDDGVAGVVLPACRVAPAASVSPVSPAHRQRPCRAHPVRAPPQRL